MVQARTISVMNQNPNEPLGAFDLECNVQLGTSAHWTIQSNLLGLKQWVQAVGLVENPTDPLPNGISNFIGAASVNIYQFEPTPPGIVLWAIQPILGAGGSEQIAGCPVTPQQLESGEATYFLTSDGGAGAPYTGTPYANSACLLTMGYKDANGNILYWVKRGTLQMFYILNCELVGFPEGGYIAFSSASGSVTISGSNLTAVLNPDPQLGTYPGPPPGTAWWENETGEASNIVQYIKSWTATQIQVGVTLQNPPPADAPAPSSGAQDTEISVQVTLQ